MGIDYNPKLIEIAKKSKNYLNLNNIEFKTQDFQSNGINEKYDIILSLANHHTYDKGITSTKDYFEKILKIISQDGYLIFEGHHPLIENDEDFWNILGQIKDQFYYYRKKI